MRVSLLQEHLNRALQGASRVVSGRAALPVLGNVLLRTSEGRLKISATNLEIGVTHYLGAKVETEGEITVPAKLFSEYVAALSAGKVELELEGDTLQATQEQFVAHFKGIAASEFPLIPELKEPKSVQLPTAELRQALQRVGFAASPEESRPVLAGVLFRRDSEGLKVVATDSYRLAEQVIALPAGGEGEEFQIIVPARAAAELVRLLDDEDEQILLQLSENQVLFKLSAAELTSRLIEGQFPDYEQIIPERHETMTVVDRDALLGAVKVADLFARESAHSIKLEFNPGPTKKDPGKITISSGATQLGDNTSIVEAQVEGRAGEISFNARYLMDLLQVVSGPIKVELSGKLNPGVFRSDQEPGYLHIVMPLRS
jgi:DNA polymerase III subunit beta